MLLFPNLENTAAFLKKKTPTAIPMPDSVILLPLPSPAVRRAEAVTGALYYTMPAPMYIPVCLKKKKTGTVLGPITPERRGGGGGPATALCLLPALTCCAWVCV